MGVSEMPQYKSILVYWDSQDKNNEGWAYRATDANGIEYSGEIGIDSSASLDDAIDQACHELGVDLNHDDFGWLADNGGIGTWEFYGYCPPGARVCCGDGEDYDEGTLDSYREDGLAVVRWDSGVVTPADPAKLRLLES